MCGVVLRFCSFFVLCHLALLYSFGWILFAWHWRVVQGREACADLCVGEFSIDVSSDSQVQSTLEGGTALEETVVVSEEDHLSCCYGLGSAERISLSWMCCSLDSDLNVVFACE